VPFQNEVFEYDKLGNRTKYNGKGYEYDTKGIRLTEDYKYIYVYDRNGNLTSKQEKGMTGNLTNYIYSTENQLVRVEMYESSFMFKEVDYIYDALGRRIEKKVQDHTAPNDKMKSFTRRYAYDGQEITVEFNESNERLAYYTHSTLRTDDVLSVDVTAKGVTEKVAQVQGSYHYLKDALGSITSVSNSSGNVVQNYHYTSYGKLTKISDFTGSDVTSSPILNTSYTYTNREYDSESGLYYYRARMYDAESGRFMQVDPFEGKKVLPYSVVGKYNYVLNNPNKYLDPNGKFIVTALIIIGATAGGYSAYSSISAEEDRTGKKYSPFKKILSITMGAALGAVAVAASIANPALAPLFVGGASFVNNPGNQIIFNENENRLKGISFSRALASAAVSAAITWVISAWLAPTFTPQGDKIIGNGLGSGLGLCYDPGIEENWSVFCGFSSGEEQEVSQTP
jgi:RHS repeat-associated protein